MTYRPLTPEQIQAQVHQHHWTYSGTTNRFGTLIYRRCPCGAAESHGISERAVWAPVKT